MPEAGVYQVRDGHAPLLARYLEGPNGDAFSPDEHHLYIGDRDPSRRIVMRWPANTDSTLAAGEAFFDMSAAASEDTIDGIRVSTEGNLCVSGSGGLWILSPQGRYLGTLRTGRHPYNRACGDYGKMPCVAVHDGLHRMPLPVTGLLPPFLTRLSARSLAGC